MGHPCSAIKIPKLTPRLLNLLPHFKMMAHFLNCQHYLTKLYQLYSTVHDQDCRYEEDWEDRPSPSMVPVPYMSHVVSKMIKKQLPVVRFCKFMKQTTRPEVGDDDRVCAICLAAIEESDEIRELANCSHVYHKDCVDAWVDQGQGTCPLCRIKLLPVQEKEAEGEADPWRLERLAYLFGEEYVLDGFCS